MQTVKDMSIADAPITNNGLAALKKLPPFKPKYGVLTLSNCKNIDPRSLEQLQAGLTRFEIKRVPPSSARNNK